MPESTKLRRRWGGLLCRLGFHRAAPYREYRDRWGDKRRPAATVPAAAWGHYERPPSPQQKVRAFRCEGANPNQVGVTLSVGDWYSLDPDGTLYNRYGSAVGKLVLMAEGGVREVASHEYMPAEMQKALMRRKS